MGGGSSSSFTSSQHAPLKLSEQSVRLFKCFEEDLCTRNISPEEAQSLMFEKYSELVTADKKAKEAEAEAVKAAARHTIATTKASSPTAIMSTGRGFHGSRAGLSNSRSERLLPSLGGSRRQSSPGPPPPAATTATAGRSMTGSQSTKSIHAITTPSAKKNGSGSGNGGNGGGSILGSGTQRLFQLPDVTLPNNNNNNSKKKRSASIRKGWGSDPEAIKRIETRAKIYEAYNQHSREIFRKKPTTPNNSNNSNSSLTDDEKVPTATTTAAVQGSEEGGGRSGNYPSLVLLPQSSSSLDTLDAMEVSTDDGEDDEESISSVKTELSTATTAITTTHTSAQLPSRPLSPSTTTTTTTATTVRGKSSTLPRPLSIIHEYFDCKLCKKCFPSKALLETHLSYSQLHRQNLIDLRRKYSQLYAKMDRLDGLLRKTCDQFYSILTLQRLQRQEMKHYASQRSGSTTNTTGNTNSTTNNANNTLLQQQMKKEENRLRWRKAIRKVCQQCQTRRFSLVLQQLEENHRHRLDQAMDPTGCLLQEDHKFYWRCKARLSFKYFYHEGYHCIEVVPQVIPSSISVMELIRHLGRKTANDLPEEEQQQEEERVVVEEEEVKVAEPHRVLLGQLGRRLYLDSDILLEAAQLEAKNHTMNATLYSSSSSSTTLLPPLYSSSSSTTLLPPLYSSSSSTHLGEDVVETVAVGEMMIKEKEEEQEEGGSNEEDGPQVDDKVTTTTLPLALALGGGGGGGGGGGVGISNPRSLRIRGNALLVANHITSRLLVDHVAILNGSKAPEDAVFFDDRNYPSSSSSSSTTTTPLLTTPPHGLRPCQVSSERLYNRWEVCDKLDELVRLQVELREAVHKAESIARCISENSQAVGLTTTTSTTTTSNTTSNTMAGVAGGVVNATTPPAVALPPPSLHDYNTEAGFRYQLKKLRNCQLKEDENL